jgi:hypothetical protein
VPPQTEEKATYKVLNRLGAALAGIGIGLAAPHWLESLYLSPLSSLLLISLGLLFLLLR